MSSLFLSKAFDISFTVFVFITVFLPGGSIYGFNFKYPLYFVLLPLATYHMFRGRQVTAEQLALLLAVPAILAAWLVLGLSHGFSASGIFRQYTDILLTLLLCWLTQVFCAQSEQRRLSFLRLVLTAITATAILKISLIAYAVLRGIPVVEMVMWLDSVFGVDLMTMDLGSLFGRVQFISDELIPVCLYIVLRYRERLQIGSLQAALTILVLLTSVLFSFSRYFWGFAAFAFLLGLVLGKRDRFQAVMIVVLASTIAVSLPALLSVYQLRFSNEVAGDSDAQRNGQIPALEHFFVDAPFLGHGLGSYTTTSIRGATESGRASYEVQLLALPAQIGLLGMCFLCALCAYYYRSLWWKSPLALTDQLSLAVLLLFWIAAGLTNPLLFHPVAGVNYATLATLSALAPRNAKGRKEQRFAKGSDLWHLQKDA